MTAAFTILFYPEEPPPESVVYQVCHHLDYKISNNPTCPFDVAFKYFDATFFSPEQLDILDEIREDVINANCLDTSKRKVNEVFQKIFGYSVEVDARHYQGKIVAKSNINGVGNGTIIDAPLAGQSLDPDSVYQKLIQNTDAKSGELIEYQVPVHGLMIPLVYLSYRSIDLRLSNIYSRVTLQTAASVFSPEEIIQIIAYAQAMGLDYGELDILRDTIDHKIYVVDANEIAEAAFSSLSEAQQQEALGMLAATFIPLVARKL